ncbi:TetR family transcriptional regulator [Actinomadura sp. NPDC000600]|uniref:TetR/AcrR family transcriptional regulator n=1 Tax=Actinomadura sp. NPDC000600 TaxID=3154262 RepID=UPI003394E4EA
MVHPQGTRDQVIDAAERLFGARGYASVTISQICAASGAPVGSVYHHFGSKAGVLRAVLIRGNEEFFAGLPAADEPSGPPGERLAAYYGTAADLVAERRALFRLFTSLRLHDDGNDEAQAIMREVDQRGLSLMAEFIEPVARAYGVADAAACARELAALNIVYTTGVVATAGHSEDGIRAGMRDLHRLVLASIRDRAASGGPE